MSGECICGAVSVNDGSLERSVLQVYLKLIVPLLKRYKSVTVPVITRYTSVTATSNIYYNTRLLRNNNGSSQLDLFICVNYPGSSFYERVCSIVFCCPFACFVFVNFTILLNFGFALSLCKRNFFRVLLLSFLFPVRSFS